MNQSNEALQDVAVKRSEAKEEREWNGEPIYTQKAFVNVSKRLRVNGSQAWYISQQLHLSFQMRMSDMRCSGGEMAMSALWFGERPENDPNDATLSATQIPQPRQPRSTPSRFQISNPHRTKYSHGCHGSNSSQVLLLKILRRRRRLFRPHEIRPQKYLIIPQYPAKGFWYCYFYCFRLTL